MKRSVLVLVAVAVVGLVVPSSAPAAETVRVFMNNLRYCNALPCSANQNTTVRVGDTVEWVFADPLCVAFHALGCYHTTTSSATPPIWDSGAMPGQNPTFGLPSPRTAFSRTFTQTGSFEYFCRVHVPGGPSPMVARIIVQPAA